MNRVSILAATLNGIPTDLVVSEQSTRLDCYRYAAGLSFHSLPLDEQDALDGAVLDLVLAERAPKESRGDQS